MKQVVVILTVVGLIFVGTTAIAVRNTDDRSSVIAIAAVAASLGTTAISAAFGFSQHEHALRNTLSLAQQARVAEVRADDVKLLRDYVRVCLHARRQGRVYETSAEIVRGRIRQEEMDYSQTLANELRNQADNWTREFGDFDRVIATVTGPSLIAALRKADSSQDKLLAQIDRMAAMWSEPDGPHFTEAAETFISLRAAHESACREVSEELEKYATGAPVS